MNVPLIILIFYYPRVNSLKEIYHLKKIKFELDSITVYYFKLDKSVVLLLSQLTAKQLLGI